MNDYPETCSQYFIVLTDIKGYLAINIQLSSTSFSLLKQYLNPIFNCYLLHQSLTAIKWIYLRKDIHGVAFKLTEFVVTTT